MKDPIELIIFDLGGTLMYDKDPWPPFFPRADAALWEVLRQAGINLEPRDLYAGFDTLFHLYYVQHRNGLDEPTTSVVLKELLRERGVTLPDSVIRSAMRAMYAVTQSNWLPEEDALPTLQILKERGFHVGLISNAADDENTQALIDKGGFRPHLEYIISSAAFGKRKPHPDIFHAALSHFLIPPERTAMVGDTYEADVVGAQQVGMNSILITRRARGVADDVRGGPDAVVSALSEIPPLIPHDRIPP